MQVVADESGIKNYYFGGAFPAGFAWELANVTDFDGLNPNFKSRDGNPIDYPPPMSVEFKASDGNPFDVPGSGDTSSTRTSGGSTLAPTQSVPVVMPAALESSVSVLPLVVGIGLLVWLVSKK
jgi:hypothetical protein